jgi:hypothetical protein
MHFRHDLLFDFYYSTEIFTSQSSRVPFATYCLLCFKFIVHTEQNIINLKHMAVEHKDIKM